jgi:hypothetical protein
MLAMDLFDWTRIADFFTFFRTRLNSGSTEPKTAQGQRILPVIGNL